MSLYVLSYKNNIFGLFDNEIKCKNIIKGLESNNLIRVKFLKIQTFEKNSIYCTKTFNVTPSLTLPKSSMVEKL